MTPPAAMYCPNCGTHGTPPRCPQCGFALTGLADAYRVNGAYLRAQDGAPIPLLGVALSGEVLGAHARIVLRQRYKNQEQKAIEAIYTFPTPSDATLVGFAMECEGRRLEAEVKERDEAFAAYDEAVAKGHGAALLEQERPNIFTASVGNLLPGEETVVEVTFLQRVTADEGALRLMIPTLVAPRYMPGVPAGDRTAHGSANPTSLVPDADRISPKIAEVAYGLTLDVVFDLGRKVTIESPSHSVVVSDAGDLRQRVSFAAKEVALDRDLVLVAEGAPGVAVGVVCHKRENEEGTFALTLVPDFFDAKRRSAGRAVVFVVDVSGSMGGASIAQAKRALQLCLRHLSEGDLFDIVPFNTAFSHFSQHVSSPRAAASDLVPFTQTTLRQADAYVAALSANGGTEMLEPLLAATRLLAGRRQDRLVVLLTDGQVGNEAQILVEVTKQAAGARMYTFGIGTNVSDLLLRELAKRTKGAVEFIHPGERIDEKVTAQFARATAARVDHVTLKWLGADAGEVAPSDPPALVDGEPWSVYGRYETAAMGRVEIRGTLAGENFFLEVPLDLSAHAERPSLPSLWAGARVRDLEELEPVALGRRAESHKKRIVELCVRHGIASKYASFVVVEKRSGERRSQGMPEARAVPVNAPAGWATTRQAMSDEGFAGVHLTRAGSFGAAGAGFPAYSMAMPAPMPASVPAPQGFSAPPPRATPQAPPAMAPSPEAARPAAQGTISKLVSGQPMGGGKVAEAFFERAKKAFGLSNIPNPFSDAASAELASDQHGPTSVDADAGAMVDRVSEDIGAIFARQGASGLWEGSDPSDANSLALTTTYLERCAQEGIDSSHAVYGAQVAKAVEALSAVVGPLALAGEKDEGVSRALLAMAAVCTGKRARGRLVAIADAATSTAVKNLAEILRKAKRG